MPVSRLEASEARNSTTEAISSTSPSRPIGVMSSQVWYIFWFELARMR